MPQALPAQTYHAAPGVSQSILPAMAPPPAHLRAYLDEEFEQTTAMSLGTLAHTLILEPDTLHGWIAIAITGH